jgi:hypothetical protein
MKEGDDAIKDMFVKDNVLHIVQGSQIVQVRNNGKEPNEWPQVHFASVGASEEFIEVFSGELLELVDASFIFGAERDAVKAAIMTVLVDGLMKAFEHLRQIRLSVTHPIPELNRQQLYENFAIALWRAYKDLFQKAVLLLCFNIGFLFRPDAEFETGLADFVSKPPSLILDVPGVLRRQRVNWQQGLHVFRNDFLEHRKKDIAEFASYYQPETAEMLFDHARRTMAELFPAFIEARFGPTWSIQEIPVEERDPKHMRRWRFVRCDPVDRSPFPNTPFTNSPIGL